MKKKTRDRIFEVLGYIGIVTGTIGILLLLMRIAGVL